MPSFKTNVKGNADRQNVLMEFLHAFRLRAANTDVPVESCHTRASYGNPPVLSQLDYLFVTSDWEGDSRVLNDENWGSTDHFPVSWVPRDWGDMKVNQVLRASTCGWKPATEQDRARFLDKVVQDLDVGDAT